MEELESVKEAFKQIEHEDAILLSREGITKEQRSVKDNSHGADPLKRDLVFGRYNNMEFLTYSSAVGVTVTKGDIDGMKGGGDKVPTLVNLTQGYWAGEDEELANSAEQREQP